MQELCGGKEQGMFKKPADSWVATAEVPRGRRAGGALETQDKSQTTQPTGRSVGFILNVTEKPLTSAKQGTPLYGYLHWSTWAVRMKSALRKAEGRVLAQHHENEKVLRGLWSWQWRWTEESSMQ